MSRGARGCALAAGAVLVAVVAFVAYTLHQLNSTLRGQSPPDVASVANSAPVAAADRLATSEMDTRLAEVAKAGAGTSLGPAAVLDECRSRQSGMWAEAWSPVECTRTVTAYFTFNGDFAQQMQDWSAALTAQGWYAEGHPLAQPLGYYQTMGGKPRPGTANTTVPYLATDLPSSGEFCKRPGSDDAVCLRFDWAERPRTHVAYLGAPDEGPQAVVRQRHDVDAAQTETAAFAGDRYVAIATIAETYFKPSGKPTQPSSPAPSYSPCYSGSGKCD